MIGERGLQRISVTFHALLFLFILDCSAGQNLFATQMATDDQIALVIQVKIISGADGRTVAGIKVWIEDESGEKYTNILQLSVNSATHNEPVFWIIAVPKGKHELILHFPSGETVNLIPWLR
ncbi:MAG TPA: hypothetical protein PKJ25_07895 [Smithellaceae bacterium]|nr:hypothetical protein [Smithellaceae bacterium]